MQISIIPYVHAHYMVTPRNVLVKVIIRLQKMGKDLFDTLILYMRISI